MKIAAVASVPDVPAQRPWIHSFGKPSLRRNDGLSPAHMSIIFSVSETLQYVTRAKRNREVVQ